MSFVDSPGFDNYESGMPVEPESPEVRARKRWLLLSGLFIMALALGLANLFLSGQSGLVLGKGELAGRVVDELQQPVQAEIMILGQKMSAWTDEDGYFTIDSIPSGRRTLLIGYLYTAQARPVEVNPGEIVDLGMIQIRTARRPGEYDSGRLEWR